MNHINELTDFKLKVMRTVVVLLTAQIQNFPCNYQAIRESHSVYHDLLDKLDYWLDAYIDAVEKYEDERPSIEERIAAYNGKDRMSSVSDFGESAGGYNLEGHKGSEIVEEPCSKVEPVPLPDFHIGETGGCD